MTRTSSLATLCSWIAVALVTLGGIASAQEQPAARPKSAKDKLALLERQVDDLSKGLKEMAGSESPEQLHLRLKEIQFKADDLAARLRDLDESRKAAADSAAEREARLNDLAEEVAALWVENKKLKQTLAASKTRPVAGYDNGFYISSPGDEFRLVLRGYIRPYYKLALQEQWNTDEYGYLVYDDGQPKGGNTKVAENGFQLAESRLRFDLRLFKVIGGAVEIGEGNLSGKAIFPVNAAANDAAINRLEIDKSPVQFYDLYAEYAPLPELAIRAGQFRVLFDRETAFAPSAWTFSSTSLITLPYPLFAAWPEQERADHLAYGWPYAIERGSSFGYDRGLMASGAVANALFNYALGFFNGGGPNAGNDNRKVLAVVRLWTDLLGPVTGSMSDIEVSPTPQLSIGGGFAYDRPEHPRMESPQSDDDTYYSEDKGATFDAHFKWMGLSALTSFFFRRADHGSAFEDPVVSSLGLGGQVAYYERRTKLEPALRYSLYDADLKLSRDEVHELTGALSYYPFGNNTKLSLQYKGLFPAELDRSYLALRGTWFDYRHEISALAQLGF